MKNNVFCIVKKYLIPLLFWLLIWELIALLVDHAYFFPHIGDTLLALKNLIFSLSTYKTVFLTLLRISAGIVLGVSLSVVFVILSHKFEIAKSILTPFISVIKITPIAIFYSLLYIKLGRFLPELVAMLMVIPIIWQNLMNAYDSIDTNLSELCEVFEFSRFKRFKLLVFPALFKYFIPALITAVGIAFKAEISMEILLYSIGSIGEAIFDAKQASETSTVFAWAIIVVVLGVITEIISKIFLRRCNNELENK